MSRFLWFTVYMGWTDVTVICGHSQHDVYVVRHHGIAYCVKVIDTDLLRV